MKKRLLTFMFVMGISVALLSGCGNDSGTDGNAEKETGAASETSGKSDEKSAEEKEQEELLGWLREASEQLAEEPVWGFKDKNVTVNEKGEKDETQTLCTVDTQKQIAMYKYRFSTNDQLEFLTKEGDQEYIYHEVQTQEDGKEVEKTYYKVPQTEEVKAAGYNTYTGIQPLNLSFVSNDSVEYVDYNLENEGEEDGAIKIKLETELKLKKPFPSITRESLLEESGWTEEQVGMIEGASEAIEAYIKENDANIERNKDKVYSNTAWYWITKDEHKLVKGEYESYILEQETEARNKYYTVSWKIDSLKSALEEGFSKEEAVKMANEIEDDSEPWPQTTEAKATTEFVSGEECEPLEELPKDAKEITWEQYMNGEY